jgi:hypothetical protein
MVVEPEFARVLQAAERAGSRTRIEHNPPGANDILQGNARVRELLLEARQHEKNEERLLAVFNERVLRIELDETGDQLSEIKARTRAALPPQIWSLSKQVVRYRRIRLAKLLE